MVGVFLPIDPTEQLDTNKPYYFLINPYLFYSNLSARESGAMALQLRGASLIKQFFFNH